MTVQADNLEEIQQAQEAFRQIKQLLAEVEDFPEAAQVCIQVAGATVSVPLPAALVQQVAEMLRHLAEGSAVSIVPLHSTLTTQQAADLLNVSRPYLVRVLEDGKIPFTKAGTHRRVTYRDVLSFKEAQSRDAETAMQELADQAQELDMLN